MHSTVQHVEKDKEKALCRHALSNTSVLVQGITDGTLPVTCNFLYATAKA